MVGWMLSHSAGRVGPCLRLCSKLDIFQEQGWNGVDLLIYSEIGKIDEIEVGVNCRLVVITRCLLKLRLTLVLDGLVMLHYDVLLVLLLCLLL